MNGLKGKYYWVKTLAGMEVAFKRNSGKWELCGISNDEDCKNAILEVYAEVVNGVTTKDSGLHLQRVTASTFDEQELRSIKIACILMQRKVNVTSMAHHDITHIVDKIEKLL